MRKLRRQSFGAVAEVVDELLREGAITGEESDLLLDLRWKLRQREDAEGLLRLFCDLRLRMEQRHYLAFFRIRRWLENHLIANVRICPAADPHLVGVKLDYYCVEAVRRVCLCAALGKGTIVLVPRLTFEFRPLEAELLHRGVQKELAVAAA